MNISVYTVTLGTRPHYFNKLHAYLTRHKAHIHEWLIGVQGHSENIDINEDSFIKLFQWEKNCGSGEANNRLIRECSGHIIVKLDDDALPYGEDYFVHIKELINLTHAAAILSPYPVGLIQNPGGVLSKEHHVIYSEVLNTFYTLRKVPHIGGFARIMPAQIAKAYTWPDDYSPYNSGKEDVNFSAHCIANNIDMYYLENAIIVEHQESTLGQKTRYESYFKNRG